MKRLQIMIEEDLDAQLARHARRERTSKAAIIRKALRKQIKPLPPIEEDPLWQICGDLEGDEDGSVSVNDIIYPR